MLCISGAELLCVEFSTMQVVYFKTDMSGPFMFCCTPEERLDFSLLGQVFGLYPISITLNGIFFSKTGTDSGSKWEHIKDLLSKRDGRHVGTEDNPVVVTGEALVLALSTRRKKGLMSELIEVRSNVTEVRSDVTEVHSDVTEVHSDVTEVRSDVTEVRSDVTEVLIEIRSNLKNISGLLHESFSRTRAASTINADDLSILRHGLGVVLIPEEEGVTLEALLGAKETGGGEFLWDGDTYELKDEYM